MSTDGSVILSLDAELAWGFWDHERPPARRVECAQEAWRRVLEVLNDHDIPATWAVVGQLLLDEFDSPTVVPDGGEPEDPADSCWFGRNLVEAILESDVGHEIGSHSFTHVEFGDPSTRPAVADRELDRSCTVAAEHGLELESFVFPRNNVGYQELLAEYGFSCYRGVAPGRWYDRTPIRRLGKAVTLALGRSGPPLVEPAVDEHGLVNIPASLYLFTVGDVPGRVLTTGSRDPVGRQVELGLERLRAERRGVLHLWFHPNNVTSDPHFDRVRDVVATIAKYRDRHDLTVRTMAEVASEHAPTESDVPPVTAPRSTVAEEPGRRPIPDCGR